MSHSKRKTWGQRNQDWTGADLAKHPSSQGGFLGVESPSRAVGIILAVIGFLAVIGAAAQ